MDCLTDYVGILVCADADVPDSGLYINSLPGISLESIVKIAVDDQATYLGVWADVQKAAQARFKVDFIAAITKCFRLSKKCDYEDLICDNKEILVNAWMMLLANQLMQFRVYSTRLNRFTTVDLPAAKELVEFYQLEYEKALTQAAQLCDISSCECVLVPGGQIGRKWLIP